MDDDHEDHKIETHYVRMHMDEEYATNITERKFVALACEADKEHINSQGLYYNMDSADDGESQCEKTYVDDD